MESFYQSISNFPQSMVTSYEIAPYCTILLLYCFYVRYSRIQQKRMEESLLPEIQKILYEKHYNHPIDHTWNSYDDELKKQLMNAYLLYRDKKYEFKDRDEKMIYFEKYPEELLYYVYFG